MPKSFVYTSSTGIAQLIYQDGKNFFRGMQYPPTVDGAYILDGWKQFSSLENSLPPNTLLWGKTEDKLNGTIFTYSRVDPDPSIKPFKVSPNHTLVITYDKQNIVTLPNVYYEDPITKAKTPYTGQLVKHRQYHDGAKTIVAANALFSELVEKWKDQERVGNVNDMESRVYYYDTSLVLQCHVCPTRDLDKWQRTKLGISLV